MRLLKLGLLCACLFACQAPEQSAPGVLLTLPEIDSSALSRLEPTVAADLRSAYQAWQSALETDQPLSAQADRAGSFGMLALAYEQYPWAADALSWASAADPGAFQWCYLLARAQIPQGQNDLAQDSLRCALRLQPEYIAARLILAEQLIDQGKLSEAETVVAVRTPETAAVLGLRGRLALAQGEHADAVALLQAALRAEPQASRLRYPLGLALRALGQVVEAKAELTQFGQTAAAVDDPLMAEVRALAVGAQALIGQAADAAEAGDYAKAIQLYRRALDSAEDAPTRLNLAISLARSGATAEAEAEYRRVLLALPESATALFGLGTLQAAQGRDEEAVQSYELALGINPEDHDARFNMANALRRLGRLATASENYAAVVAADPARVDARLAQGQILVEQGRWQDAATVLQQSLRTHPNEPRIALQLARLLAAAPEDSVRDGAAALQLASSLFGADRSLPHGEVLAMALAEQGRFEEAANLQLQLLSAVRAQGRQELIGSVQRALDSYREAKPIRLP